MTLWVNLNRTLMVSLNGSIWVPFKGFGERHITQYHLRVLIRDLKTANGKTEKYPPKKSFFGFFKAILFNMTLSHNE